MQEHTLIGLGDVERVTRLLRAEALDVAQRDDLPLARRQLGDRRQRGVARLLVLEPLVWERLRRGLPGSGRRAAGAEEPVRVDSRPALLVGRSGRRERD